MSLDENHEFRQLINDEFRQLIKRVEVLEKQNNLYYKINLLFIAIIVFLIIIVFLK